MPKCERSIYKKCGRTCGRHVGNLPTGHTGGDTEEGAGWKPREPWPVRAGGREARRERTPGLACQTRENVNELAYALRMIWEGGLFLLL